MKNSMRFTNFYLVGFRYNDLNHPKCSHKSLLGVNFVLIGELDLVQLSSQHMKRIALDGQCCAQERQYMKCICCSVENGDRHKELSFVQSILILIKRLGDNHTYFNEIS